MASVDLSVPAVTFKEKTPGVWWITFDRPKASNALTRADFSAIISFFKEIEETATAVVFTGRGKKTFSGGMHLGELPVLTPNGARKQILENRDLLATIRTASFPTIAAINGHCLAAGFGISLVCDLRIASNTATFGLPEVKVGVPSVCDIALLQQFVGLSFAKEMILTGDTYPIAAFAHTGFLNAVVPPDTLVAETEAMLARVTCHTKTVIAAQKRLFETWQNTSLTAGIDVSMEVFAGVFSSKETFDQIGTHRSIVSNGA